MGSGQQTWLESDEVWPDSNGQSWPGGEDVWPADSPRGWPSENTRGLLREIGGFLYHSEGSADDVPYYEVVDSEPMLVVPYSKTYNDSRFLMNPGFASPRDFLDTMVMGLDELLREGEERRTMMTVAVHARWSGQAARAAAMRMFLEHATQQPGVAFLRRRDIARWWLDTYPPG